MLRKAHVGAEGGRLGREEMKRATGSWCPPLCPSHQQVGLFSFKSLESRILNLISPKDHWDKLFSPLP